MEKSINRAQTAPIESSLPPTPGLSTDNSAQPLSAPQQATNRNYWKIATGSLIVIVILCGFALTYTMMKKTVTESAALTTIPTVQPSASAVPESPAVTPTDPATNWQTYTSSIYGFEFQYPSKYKTTTDVSGWPHSIVLLSFVHLTDGQSYSLVAEHWDSLADFQQANSSKSYFKDYTVFNNPKGGIITILNLDKVNYPNDSDPNKVISSFKFTGQVTTSDSLKYTYDTFSFTYPGTWKVLDNTTDPNFFIQNNIKGFKREVFLQNGDYSLLIGINSGVPEGQAGGVFIDDTTYQDYLRINDPVMIRDEKFFLWKGSTSLATWNKPPFEAGIVSLASLSKYVANKVPKNNQGKSINGYEDYFQKNGKSYLFAKFSKTDVESSTFTPDAIQKDIKSILESIRW